MTVGTLYVIDALGCARAVLNDTAFIEHLSAVFADAVRTTVMRRLTYAFHPQGITTTAVLAESHLTIHTWPELDLVSIDLFACGPGIDINSGLSVLDRLLKPAVVSVFAIDRGSGTLQGRVLETP